MDPPPKKKDGKKQDYQSARLTPGNKICLFPKGFLMNSKNSWKI